MNDVKYISAQNICKNKRVFDNNNHGKSIVTEELQIPIINVAAIKESSLIIPILLHVKWVQLSS